MRNALIIDSVRTAVGRMGGTLKDIEVDYLAAKVLDEIVVRTGIEKSEVDEVIIGQAKQSTDSPNLARLALLRAGFPIEITGYTVHRQCGFGIQSMNNGAQQIMSGLSDIVIAGGAESMSTLLTICEMPAMAMVQAEAYFLIQIQKVSQGHSLWKFMEI